MMDLARQFLSTFYSEEVWFTLATYGVHPLQERSVWLPDAERLFFVAGTDGLSTPHVLVENLDAVLASTCIDHAEADPQRLCATVVADLVHGAVVARALSLPLLSFVGSGEEMFLVPGGEERASGWMIVVEAVAQVFHDLHLPPGSQLFLSHLPAIWETLTSSVGNDRDRLPKRHLQGLYHITDGSLFPLGTPFGYYYEYYRYNVAHYRRCVLEQLLKRPLRGILVVENVQQVKAIALARHLNTGWPTEHLVTLPAPGRSGNERGTRVASHERLPLTTLWQFHQTQEWETEARLSGEHLRFWTAVCQSWDRLSTREETQK